MLSFEIHRSESFLVCFYLELGNLELNMDLFSFETRSYSWWLVNGHGCEIMEDQLTATYEVKISNQSCDQNVIFIIIL